MATKIAKRLSYEALRAGIADLWTAMSVHQSRLGAVDAAARRVVANKARYLPIQAKTGVPWPMIGILHLRESSLNFNKHLHNGDPLTARTVRVPAGHPRTGKPPFTFEASAIDALAIKGWVKAKWDWTIERVLYEAERYNGFGYRRPGRPNSPYIWASTNQYTRGKFIKDRVYDPNHVDRQLGVAPVLRRIMDLDPEHGLYLEGQKKTATETITGSKSLPLLIFGFLWEIGTQITGAFQSAWDALVFGVSALPALIMGAQEHVTASQTVAEWLSVDWASVGRWVTLTALAIVFFREFGRKRVRK